jgi:hypothetical protein
MTHASLGKRSTIERQWRAHEALKKSGHLVPLVFRTAVGCPGRLLHDCRPTAVRNLERAGVSRSVAMAIAGQRTEVVYRRYAIVSSRDLADASRKLQAFTGTLSGTVDRIHPMVKRPNARR